MADPSATGDFVPDDLLGGLDLGDGPEEEEVERDFVDELEAEDDDDLELEIMDPNHPAMQRVQAALKTQLTSELDRLNNAIYAKTGLLKDARRRREDKGVELYAQQQLLAKTQMQLEGSADGLGELNERNAELAELAERNKDEYEQLLEESRRNEEEFKAARRAADAARAKQMDAIKAAETVESNLKVAQRAASKADIEESEMEQRKQRQDLLVDQLEERRKELQNRIKIHETQTEAQRDQTQQALQRLNEAQAELDAAGVEKREISQQWQLALKGLRQRNDMAAKIKQTADEQQQQLFAEGVVVDNLRKQIRAEQLSNEELEARYGRVDAECSQYRRLLADVGKKMDAAKGEFSLLTKDLKVREASLQKASIELGRQQTAFNAVRTRIEKLARNKQEVEEEIVQETYGYKTLTKAGKALVAEIKKAQKQSTETEILLTGAMNNTARLATEEQSLRAARAGLEGRMAALQSAMDEKNTLMSQYEAQASRNAIEIERKETAIVLLSRKIAAVAARRAIEGAGKANMSPQELERDRLQDLIAATQEGNREKQQEWLHAQSRLVDLLKDIQSQEQAVGDLKTKSAVFSQKKFRIQREMEEERKELRAVERAYAALQKDVTKLNTLIAKNGGVEAGLESDNALIEAEFLRFLKEEELASIRTQEKVRAVREAREKLTTEMVEAERQILEWEKKITLAKEMRETIQGGGDENETAAMNKEIHRMELRLSQLARHREVLIQEMEKAVEKRGDISVAKRTAKVRGQSTVSTTAKKLADLQKRVRQTKKDNAAAEREIARAEADGELLHGQVAETRAVLDELRDTRDDLGREMLDKRVARARGGEAVLYFQRMQRALAALREKGGARRPSEEYDRLLAVQTQQLQELNNIAEYLVQQEPAAEADLDPVRVSINARLELLQAGK